MVRSSDLEPSCVQCAATMRVHRKVQWQRAAGAQVGFLLIFSVFGVPELYWSGVISGLVLFLASIGLFTLGAGLMLYMQQWHGQRRELLYKKIGGRYCHLHQDDEEMRRFAARLSDDYAAVWMWTAGERLGKHCEVVVPSALTSVVVWHNGGGTTLIKGEDGTSFDWGFVLPYLENRERKRTKG